MPKKKKRRLDNTRRLLDWSADTVIITKPRPKKKAK
jgi:hypothetical protein